jgi:hypothetical protein
MGSDKEDDKKADLLAKLNKEIRFHSFWQSTMMTLYVITATGTVLASTGATVMAALEISVIASILAGIATILISVEKTLLFKKKWRVNLKTYTLLKNLANKLRFDAMELQAALKEFESIALNYSADLPFAEENQ